MGTNGTRELNRLAVIGAGNMGSGIAQKMATEGFEVVLVDLDDEKVARGEQIIEQTLSEAVERKIFKPQQAEAIRGRVTGTSDWNELGNVDLVVEAVFEDLGVKRDVFRRLAEVCSPEAILATNTSSFSVTSVAEDIPHPERVVGLHYFYHPAKNRLVEVIPGARTAPEAVRAAWALQEQMGKTPIASADASGFIVNRYFVVWLNEAVRLLEENVADIPTIEAACKKTFGVGMGPFELMNVTGVPIALHAATTLGESFGPLYAPAQRLADQVASGEMWDLEGPVDELKFDAVNERILAAVFYVAAALVDEQVGTPEDTDIGARVGLRWPAGPFQMINRYGVEQAAELVGRLAERWDLKVPTILAEQAAAGRKFSFRLVKTEIDDGVATLTVNRPDAMNALNERVVEQLHQAFRDAAANPEVRGIVIAGAGKAFIAGADIRFFVRNMDAGDLDRIVKFTRAGHDLLGEIDRCPKPVVARLHGLALGGGLELALACDLLVATPKTTIAFPETGIGIYPGLGGTQRASRRVGRGLAKWLIFTGQMLGGEEAEAIGLVDAVVPQAEMDRKIRELIDQGETTGGSAKLDPAYQALDDFFSSHSAAELQQGKADTGGDEKLARAMKQVGYKAPIALSIAEKLIDGSEEGTLEDGLQRELDHLVEIFRSKDAYEGLSTLGKKRPEFRGQ